MYKNVVFNSPSSLRTEPSSELHTLSSSSSCPAPGTVSRPAPPSPIRFSGTFNNTPITRKQLSDLGRAYPSLSFAFHLWALSFRKWTPFAISTCSFFVLLQRCMCHHHGVIVEHVITKAARMSSPWCNTMARDNQGPPAIQPRALEQSIIKDNGGVYANHIREWQLSDS